MTPNISGLTQEDVVKLDMLKELAAKNQWYSLAQNLVHARDHLQKMLESTWADTVLHNIEPAE